MLDYMIYTSVKLKQVAPKVFFRVISDFVSSKNMQIKDIVDKASKMKSDRVSE